jgi:hypothetical protein
VAGWFFIAVFILTGIAVLLGWSADSRRPGKWWPGQR